jgi:hypothetical protein
MVLPQFSLRTALGLMVVLAFVSLVVSRGLQGSPWAMGVSVALFALVFSFLSYAAVFGIVYLVSKAWNRRVTPAQKRSAPADATPPPRESADLFPSASELT